MDNATFIGLMRVQNEARWIEEVLDALWMLCERIYLMDDHSEDDTAQIAARSGAEVLPSPFEQDLDENGIDRNMDEARDKEWLTRLVGDREGWPENTWVAMIDGDEVLEGEGSARLRILMERQPADCYALQVPYLWNNRRLIRTDGVYHNLANRGRPSVFRLKPEATLFRTGRAKGNMHCSSTPVELGHAMRTDVRLLHLGYMRREDRVRKYEWYKNRDGDSPTEDGYRHIVIGDEFPADSKFTFGGPLRLEPLADDPHRLWPASSWRFLD